MKKLLFGIALATVLVTGTYGFNQDRFDTAVGVYAPMFTVSNSAQSVNLGDFRGGYTIVTFWESADAESRMACSRYEQMLRSGDIAADISFIGINFDKSSALFEEIVKADRLDSNSQFRVAGDDAELLRARYGLDNGMGSILIGPDGRVVAYNPDKKYLKKLKNV